MMATPRKQNYDLVIIGGGINGTAIAADAAGRGLSVLLCEQYDLAQATSSASSKLIHGGLRYLEQFEFGLVRESLKEREILLRKAPCLILPQQFIMPHNNTRPAWLIRIGLFIYDYLGGKSHIPKSKQVKFVNSNYGKPLKPSIKKGFSYYDCWTDDSRLVVLNALCAKQHGADIITRTQFVKAERHANNWEVTLSTGNTPQQYSVQTKCLVNAAGPWVDTILRNRIATASEHQLALVKGSHIVTKKLYQGEHAYMLQNNDQRVIFVIPFNDSYSLIGTTDVNYQGDPHDVKISPKEIDYLCNAVNQYFSTPIKKENIVWSYSGVRPLVAETAEKASKLSRDYKIELDFSHEEAPILSVFGGKITTHRHLAEQALNKLEQFFPNMTTAWTANSQLPGGNIKDNDLIAYDRVIQQRFPWLSTELRQRYIHAYGTLLEKMLDQKQSLSDLGQDFGHGLYKVEVDYLCNNEWAQTAEDILWRRSKLGLKLTKEEAKRLTTYLQSS